MIRTYFSRTVLSQVTTQEMGSFNTIFVSVVIAFSIFSQSSEACEACSENKLSSEGNFAKFYPRFLGTWAYSGEWDGNPFFTCNDCMGLRAFVVRILYKDFCNREC